jgi:redox-sensitive bicupin YhaK (pirin superfamily)
MKFEIIRAATRGHLNFGWLDTHHTFSFGEYYNPKRMHFGALRVLNDDYIEPNSMFPLHPHENMEIITLVLAGSVEHQDSLGNKTIITAGEIQVMSAGNGILHSEANPSSDEELNLFQIWIYPHVKNISPCYNQSNFNDKLALLNQWQLLVAPIVSEAELKICQDAYLYLGKFDNVSTNYTYSLNNAKHGVFMMVIEGELELNGQSLYARDAIMIQDIEIFSFRVNQASRLLLIEVPLLI